MANKFDKVMPVRKEEALAFRLTYCRQMLYVHGFLTEKENRKLRDKLPQEVK